MSVNIDDNRSMAEASLSEPFIGKREVARRLGKTVRTVDNWMRRGMLPYYKCNRTVTFRWSEVQRFMGEEFLVCGRGRQRPDAKAALV